MNSPQGHPPQEAADRLAGQWCDYEPGRAGHDTHPDGGEPLSPEHRRRAVDLRLVHSMLMHLYDRDEVGRQRRIDEVMRRIRSGRGGASWRPIPRALRAVRWSLAAAAVVLLAVALSHLVLSNPAMAALDRMIAAVEMGGDRAYFIALRDQTHGGGRHRRPTTQEESPPPRKATLDGATLYLRGKDMFVLERPSSSGKMAVSGFDGRQGWFVRPNRPVLVSDDPARFRIPMPEDLAAVLSLDMKATLERIRDRYGVEHLGGEALGDETGGPAWTHLRATKRDHEVRGPKVVELWSHPDSGLLRRIVFENVKVQGQPTPRHITIDLVSQTPLPADWFTHQAHHPADAVVESVTE